MTAARWIARAAVACVMLQAPGLAHADVYKCRVDGRTVYQDTPCPGAAELAPYKADRAPAQKRAPQAIAAPAGRRPYDAPPASTPRGLYEQMQDAREYSEVLQTRYDHEVKQARARAPTMSQEQQRRLSQALHAKWDHQLQAAGTRERKLSEALRRMCPGGASINERTEHCLKRPTPEPR